MYLHNIFDAKTSMITVSSKEISIWAKLGLTITCNNWFDLLFMEKPGQATIIICSDPVFEVLKHAWLNTYFIYYFILCVCVWMLLFIVHYGIRHYISFCVIHIITRKKMYTNMDREKSEKYFFEIE